jgi:hypothetical protein
MQMQQDFNTATFEWMVASCQLIAILVNPTLKKMISVTRSNLHMGGFKSYLLAQKPRIDKRLK